MQTNRVWRMAAAGLFLAAGSLVADSTWRSDVPDGYYDQASNWVEGVLPTNTAVGLFTGNQDYVIRFPLGGYAENSVTKVSLASGRSLTFDTRGTWWLKDAPTTTSGWPNSWTGFQVANSSGSHLFNIEGLATSSVATNYPIMLMSNAVFRYHSRVTVTNVLEEGLLNLYDPGGKIYTGHTLITGSAGTRHVAVFKTNSTLRANQIRMRGNANGNFMLFEGGDHAIYGGLQLGEGATNARWTNTVEVSGGTLAFPGSALYISHGKTNSYGVFSVSGSGVVTLANNIVMSSNQGRTLSALRLSDSAVLRAGTYLDVAYTLASTATVSLAGSALLSLGSNLAVARGNESFATLDLRDQSACTAGGYLLVGGYSGSDGTVTVQDGATLHVVNYAEAGTGGGTGRLRLTGGRLIAKNVRGGAGGSSEFYADGGTLCASNTSGSVSLLVNFGLAELGATGLTLDSAGNDAAIGQAFADASGADGRFLKIGAGTLSVSNSTHALTVVAQGGLRVLDAAAVFGRSLVVTNQAALSLSGAAAELTVGNLTLGEPGAPASLHMDAGDRITVTNSGGLTLASCGLFFGSPSTDGTYDLFRCAGSVDGSVLNNLAVFNPALGKDYTFTIVPDDTDSIIRLTVADFAITEAVWNGSQGSDWNTAANWTPAELPTNGTRTFFNADGEQKTVNLSAPAVCTYLNFNSVEPYLLQGAQLSVAVGGVSNTLGTHTLAMPLALAGGITVGTASAATTTVSGAVSGNLATTVTKTGSGTLTLSGDNAAFAGTWQTSGGRLEAASPTALGGANTATDAVTLGAGTFTYSGTPTTLNKGITLNSGNISNAVIIDARSDLGLIGPFTMQPSLLCKRGAGALTLTVGNGTTLLSVGSGSGGVNITPTGTINLPENGDAPASPTGLGGFNILEGTFRVKGNGSGVSTVDQRHFGIIGGQFAAALADPVLELDAVRMNQGGSGQHLLLGNQMSASSPAREPTLRLLNGAILALDHLRMGVAPATTFAPTLVMSNATLSASWQISIGADNNTAPVVRLRQGSSANASGGNQWGGGVYVSRNVDVLVAEGSVLGQSGAVGSFRFSDGYSSGIMRFESGGTMRFTQFQGRNPQTTTGLNLVFDGGVMEPTLSGFSYSTAADKQSVLVAEGGLTVKVSGGVRHAFHFPITGTGALTKTGAGELVFGHGVAYTTASETNAVGLPTFATALATGNYTGGTVVQEGTLSVSNGTIRADAAVAVAAGARLNLCGSAVTLGEVSGSGTVSNGVLYAGYRCGVSETGNDCLAFADVTLPAAGFTVTFAPAEGYALTNRQVLAVATRSGATELNLPAWQARNVGTHMSATFSLEGNTVYARVAYTGGTLIRVR